MLLLQVVESTCTLTLLAEPEYRLLLGVVTLLKL